MKQPTFCQYLNISFVADALGKLVRLYEEEYEK
ncbi:hypothetical protein OKW21_000062 [Catalinimonas alkaloidigena]|nr:hypothetical protein [Catalinimonas alkaloidigena]